MKKIMNMVITDFYKHINRAGIALMLTLSACSEGGLPVRPGEVDDTRIPLRVAGASTGAGIGVQTRADGGDDNRTELTSGSIGMFLKENAANGYKALANLKFTCAAPFWQTDEQILLGGQEATLAACYPYAPARVNPVMLHSREYSADEDFHYTNFRADNRQTTVTLDLSRVYSRIVFNFKKDDYYTDSYVTAIRFQGQGIIPVATLDMFDPVPLSPGGSVRDILVPFTSLNVAEISDLTTQVTSTAQSTADCLMIPAQLQGDITLTITVDGKKMAGKVTAEQLCGAGGILAEGVKYEINILIKELEGIEIESIKITNWDSQPSWDENVTFIPLGIQVPETDINLGGTDCTAQDKKDLSMLIWAPGNLRQANDDGSGPTIFAGPTDYGHYYTWFSTYTGNTDMNDTDPCFALDAYAYGTGWRTPGKNELEKLARCTNKQMVFHHGKKGIWFMNKTSGLFLPAAGCRYYDEGSGTTPSGDAGGGGYYWSSDADAWNDYSNGYYMNFYRYDTTVSDFDKLNGFSVRCVKAKEERQ